MQSVLRIQITIESDPPGEFFAHGELLQDARTGMVVGAPRSKCLDCGGPQRVAPCLVSELGHPKGTHFTRQPKTIEERIAALEAIRVCCNDSLALRNGNE